MERALLSKLLKSNETLSFDAVQMQSDEIIISVIRIKNNKVKGTMVVRREIFPKQEQSEIGSFQLYQDYQQILFNCSHRTLCKQSNQR